MDVVADDDASQERPTVRVHVEVAAYSPLTGVGSWWEPDAVLRAEVWETPERIVVLSGDRAALLSLARHLLALTQDAVPSGTHFDFDTYGRWLEEASLAIRLELDPT